MGTVTTLSNTLFGRTRGALLAILYGHPGESHHMRELARLAGIALGPVQRELRQLLDAGLVTREERGTQTLYQANKACPVFPEMKSLVARTVGVSTVLLAALQPLQDRMDLAFVADSPAPSQESGRSTLDLLIVGKLTDLEANYLLSHAQKVLNRTIKPRVYTSGEFRAKLRGPSRKALLGGQKLFVIGDEKVLGQLARR